MWFKHLEKYQKNGMKNEKKNQIYWNSKRRKWNQSAGLHKIYFDQKKTTTRKYTCLQKCAHLPVIWNTNWNLYSNKRKTSANRKQFHSDWSGRMDCLFGFRWVRVFLLDFDWCVNSHTAKNDRLNNMFSYFLVLSCSCVVLFFQLAKLTKKKQSI